MGGAETAVVLLLAAAAAAAVAVLVAVVRHAPRSRAAQLAGRGEFAAALAAAAGPADRRAAAIAAKHLLRFDQAAGLLDSLLAEDPADGEALLERGLVAAYAGQTAAAAGWLERAAVARADLAESITLHRAWLELGRGDHVTARRLFEEIEAPLESKLRADLDGDPLFAEWYLHAAALWRAGGRPELAAWALAEGARAAPASRLPELLAGHPAAAAGPPTGKRAGLE